MCCFTFKEVNVLFHFTVSSSSYYDNYKIWPDCFKHWESNIAIDTGTICRCFSLLIHVDCPAMLVPSFHDNQSKKSPSRRGEHTVGYSPFFDCNMIGRRVKYTKSRTNQNPHILSACFHETKLHPNKNNDSTAKKHKIYTPPEQFFVTFFGLKT